MCHVFGNGVDGDERETFKWLSASAEQGYAPAQAGLGFCYEEAVGVDENLGEAAKWYKKAAEGLRKAAEAGDAEAAYRLSMMYRSGKGVNENPDEAAKWCRKAAEGGYALAQFRTGECYADGDGVDKDIEKAAEWWKKGAAQNDPSSQFALGACHVTGAGAEKDLPTAVGLFVKAAAQEEENAVTMLHTLALEGQPDAFKWLQEQSDKGDAWAMEDLGECYAKGIGVEKDEAKAKELISKAEELFRAMDEEEEVEEDGKD